MTLQMTLQMTPQVTLQIQTTFIKKIRKCRIHRMLITFQFRMSIFLSPLLTVKDHTSNNATFVMWLQKVSHLTHEEKERKSFLGARI
jgi:hypothetical protein